MNKKLVILILILFTTSTSAVNPKTVRRAALKEGLALAAVDGEIIEANNTWFFKFDSDIKDDEGPISAGETIQLLPSAMLEKIVADLNSRSKASYRLWGKVTKYKDENFIFPTYFLPLSKIKPLESPEPEQKEKKKPDVAINDPNDAFAMPEEIIAKLSTRKVIRTRQLEKPLELKQDSILVDRIGFIENTNGQLIFTLDALGRNFPRISFQLLPCDILQRAQRKQSVYPNKLRFKVAGVVTRYKNENYLLLQRAARIYSHGNFGR